MKRDTKTYKNYNIGWITFPRLNGENNTDNACLARRFYVFGKLYNIRNLIVD